MIRGKKQYGNTLFLKDFHSESAAEKLKQLHFERAATESAPYNEAWLQRLMMDQPSLLPVDQIEPAFANLMPVCTELPMRSGYLDNLFITPQGDLALVECKLWRNPEARREVVGQIIDYAKEMATWTYETLQDAIAHAPAIGGSDKTKKPKLFDLVSASEETDEASFHDAVTRNLSRGRFLLLIVGDGVREGVEAMTEFLQQYAGFHFTLALVEIALFELPAGGYIAQPRVLARTVNIERGIVTLHEGRISIAPPRPEAITAKSPAIRTTITEERFFEELNRNIPDASRLLKPFINEVASCNVSTDFGKDSIILRWRSPDGRSWNLGTITSRGEVWMDYLGQQAGNAGLIKLSKHYLAALAKLVPGAKVRETLKETAWNVAGTDGKNIRIDALLADQARRTGWLHAISEFQAAVVSASDNTDSQ